MKLIADLSKFERILWLTSVCTIIGAFLLSGDDILTIIASLIGVTALIFVAKGYVAGQILTIIFAVFYGIISYFFRYYGEMITYLCMTAPIAAITVVSWLKHPYEGTKEVKVSRLTRASITIMLLSAIAVTIAFYFILKALGNTNLLFSTISITTSFIASYLTFCRSPYYAIAYAANDIILIILWTLATLETFSYFPMVVCFIMFFLNDLYGFHNWEKMHHRQQKN